MSRRKKRKTSRGELGEQAQEIFDTLVGATPPESTSYSRNMEGRNPTYVSWWDTGTTASTTTTSNTARPHVADVLRRLDAFNDIMRLEFPPRADLYPAKSVDEVWSTAGLYYILENGDILVNFPDNNEVTVLQHGHIVGRLVQTYAQGEGEPTLCIKRGEKLRDTTHVFHSFSMYDYGRTVGAYEERSRK